VIRRLEYGGQVSNPRHEVTNFPGGVQELYDVCIASVARPRTASGRRKWQVGLFATRTSCQNLAANQLRVFSVAFDYALTTC
jgi:hypothetical protein